MQKKTYYSLAAIMFLVAMLAAACSAPAPATAAPAEVPTFASQPTAEPPSNPPVVQPTVANPAVALAPICQATTSCEALNAEQIQLDCVKKVPYTNVLIPGGTNYEVADKTGSFSCDDTNVVVNSKKVITCHGPELFSFELRLTNPSCGGDGLATGTGQCQEGYGYDSAQQCCAPVTAGSAGSTSVTVNLGGCPLPNTTKP